MTQANQANIRPAEKPQSVYTQLTTYFDERHQVAWYYMHAKPRPCFTPTLLREIRSWFAETTRRLDAPESRRPGFMVLASDIPGVFNLGGDLDLFRSLIRQRNHAALLRYAKSCIDVLHLNIVGLNRGVTTISLVQGDALGGGFEAAISSNVLVAERQSRMGMPEILFNLFPGMGAYSLLSRKIGATRAERMILSGRIYTAGELHDMGVVDILAEDGQGEQAVYDYIRREKRYSNGYRALREAKAYCNPVPYDELMNITKVWVDAAMRLNHKDLRMMERLVSRQTTRLEDTA